MTSEAGAVNGGKVRSEADALLETAVFCHQRGQIAEAEHAYRALLGRDPSSLTGLANLALLFRQTGRADEGIALLRKALGIDPTFAGALYSLGNAEGARRRHGAAARAFRHVVALSPDHAYALNNLGNVHRDLGQWAEAATAYRRAALGGPGYADARVHLGIARQQLGDAAGAADSYRKALALDPGKVEALLNLGNVLLEGDAALPAARCYARALGLRPVSSDARGNYASAIRDLGRLDEAVAHYHAALAINPTDENAHNNLGNTLNFLGRPADAVGCYRRALRVNPNGVLAHFDLGLTLLHLGRCREGWDEYEWRWGSGGLQRVRGLPQPLWDGSPAPGRTLLVHAEQGMGDAIQFLRYLPLVAERVGAIVLEIHQSLICLAEDLPKVVSVVPRGGPLPPFDLHVPMLSLPRVFGTDLDSIPTTAPYMRVGSDLVTRWARCLEPAQGLRVGVVWAGSPTFKGDRQRSPRLAAMMPLFDVPGVHFFGLQMGDGRRDLEGRTMPACFTDLGPEIRDFADTAAIMETLDLVISSCTAPVHLAGALGRPAWVVLPFAADWRWLTEREDSPWYPTLRLFRQRAPGPWEEVVGRVAGALGACAADHAVRRLVRVAS